MEAVQATIKKRELEGRKIIAQPDSELIQNFSKGWVGGPHHHRRRGVGNWGSVKRRSLLTTWTSPLRP